MKHIVCFSGGHSSALVAIEVVRRYGKDDVVLLNHDINPSYEDKDIKRFKSEVAAYLKLPITYANILGIKEPEKIPNQFQVCMIASAFKVGDGTPLCTNRLKTAPFVNWLNANCSPGLGIIYYGFDKGESDRIIRRRKICLQMGYESAYPLAEWSLTIKTTKEISIDPPCTYEQFKHANCIGCLRGKKQHWYVVFCLRPDIWQQAKAAEDYIGYSILPEGKLKTLEHQFEAMQFAGIPQTEHIPSGQFWALVRKSVPGVHFQQDLFSMPCECVI